MTKTVKNKISINELIKGIKSGNRLTLSKAITLVESKKEADQILAAELIDKISDQKLDSIRLGITGVPGVGKSTFIETFGQHAINEGKKVAVLTVDPSSSISKGSILGDKTRMNVLSQSKNAFIRPSPAGDHSGGVNNKTRESILLCEATGFDLIIVETVGVGQSEVVVKGMVDFFLVLMLAGSGDELQGIKRGIMELADGIVINKADGSNEQNALLAKGNVQNALHYFPLQQFGWKIPVELCSSINGSGINSIWSFINSYKKKSIDANWFFKNRNDQMKDWMFSMIDAKIKRNFYNQTNISEKLTQMTQAVINGEISVRSAVNRIFE